jgi:hypothetical protein
MSKKRILAILAVALVFLMVRPLSAEKISLKLSFNINSYNEGDLKEWVRGLNSLWQDYSTEFPGSLSGQFLPPNYGSNFEVELRIPLFKGLAVNLGGNRTSGAEEGTVNYVREGGNQEEVQFLLNDVRALNLKIGISYRVAIPSLPALQVFGTVGRHLLYVDYDVIENYEATVRKLNQEFSYSFERENSFKSDALGFYAGLGVEYDVMKYVALVAEVEKIWSKVDGFKGSHLYQIFQENALVNEEKGKATSYYYESNQFDSPTYYPVLTGHMERPEDDNIKNLRQGELNFSRFSVKLGVRFKF